jgi:hypothetical protein
MIEKEAITTVRENVHQLVDTLPEDRLADVFDYLADLKRHGRDQPGNRGRH